MAINTGIGVAAWRVRGLRTAGECPKLPGTARENHRARGGRRPGGHDLAHYRAEANGSERGPILYRKSAWRCRLDPRRLRTECAEVRLHDPERQSGLCDPAYQKGESP